MTTTASAKLSCNHTIKYEVVPDAAQVGAKVECDRCKPKADGSQPERTIKSVVRQVPETTEAPAVAAKRGSRTNAEIIERAELRASEQEKVTVDENGALLDRNDRREAAKFEAKMLANWRKAGNENEARPATPNLDQLEREAKENRKPNGAKATPAKAKAAARTPRTSTPLNVETKAARDACGGKRGAGTKVTLDELTKVCATYQASHPDATSASAMEHAYYVGRLAFSRKTWTTAWDAASAS